MASRTKMLTHQEAEKAIEKAVVKYARKRGWLAYKFSSPGKRDVPDYEFMQSGWMFMIEFKAEGEEPSVTQKREHNIIRERGGFIVLVIDSIEDGRRVVDMMTDRLNAIRAAQEAGLVAPKQEEGE